MSNPFVFAVLIRSMARRDIAYGGSTPLSMPAKRHVTNQQEGK